MMPVQPVSPSQAPAPPTGLAERMLRLCSRETSSGRFIPQIDGLRAMAVLAVVLFHLDLQLGKPGVVGFADRALAAVVRRGFLGVPIFFAISAFIVALPFAQRWLGQGRPVETGRFYLRRLTRLEPPYIINLLVIWIAGALLGHWALADTGQGFLASLAYQHNQLFGFFSTINSVAWSLEVEFQFYLLAPLLALVFAIGRRWCRWLLLLVISGFIVGLRDIAVRRVELSLLGQFEYFVVGLLVVDVYLSVWLGRLPGKPGWDLAGCLGWLWFFGSTGLVDPALRSACQIPGLMLGMLGCLGGFWLGRIFGNRWIFTFGGMCYSFYLWHQWLLIGLIPRFQAWTGDHPSYAARFAWAAVSVVPFVFAACALLFVTLEKPFMKRDWPARSAAWLRRKTAQS